MPAEAQHSNQFKIEVDGSPLSAELEPNLRSVLVDTNINLPDLFMVTLRDAERNAVTTGGLRIGARIVIKVHSESNAGGEKLVDGEITALEAEINKQGTFTVVRGLDRSHRLQRGCNTRTYVDMTYADIATDVARRAGLDVATVDSTQPRHDHVSQVNTTDLAFLRGLAREVGFEVGVFEGKFNFREPVASSGGPSEGTLVSTDPLQLTLGSNLLRCRATVTSAEQVRQVEVRGWDVTSKEAVVAQQNASTTSADIGTTPAQLADVFHPPKLVSVGVPYGTQTEVDSAARALSEEVASAFAELEGVAKGTPAIRAGSAVSLGLVKEPFDGKYTVTQARHSWEPDEGYLVSFTVSGNRDRSIRGLIAGSNGVGSGSGSHLGAGVVSAIVTNCQDPRDLGRVKLKFPWLSADYESDWARVAFLGAGDRRGWVVIPEVNDEVLVAFDHGDVRFPFVIGGLYNGVDSIDPALQSELVDGANGAINTRAFTSRSGHQLIFRDKGGSESISIETGDDNYSLTLDQAGTKVVVKSNGEVHIEAVQDMKLSSSGGNIEISGVQVKITASGGLTMDGGASAELKGGIVKIN